MYNFLLTKGLSAENVTYVRIERAQQSEMSQVTSQFIIFFENTSNVDLVNDEQTAVIKFIDLS